MSKAKLNCWQINKLLLSNVNTNFVAYFQAESILNPQIIENKNHMHIVWTRKSLFRKDSKIQKMLRAKSSYKTGRQLRECPSSVNPRKKCDHFDFCIDFFGLDCFEAAAFLNCSLIRSIRFCNLAIFASISFRSSSALLFKNPSCLCS